MGFGVSGLGFGVFTFGVTPVFWLLIWVVAFCGFCLLVRALGVWGVCMLRYRFAATLRFGCLDAVLLSFVVIWLRGLFGLRLIAAILGVVSGFGYRWWMLFVLFGFCLWFGLVLFCALVWLGLRW